MSEALQLLLAAPAPFALACAAAFGAAVLGGLSGYGTGLILPVFVVPLVGVANVVPVMAVAMLLNNGSRVLAFRREIDGTHARRLLWLGLPACLAGAWGYTLLSARWVAVLLGAFLLASVPLRRALRRLHWRPAPGLEIGAGACFGFLDGGMTGTGVILVSMLMSFGVAGPALIATDAVVSVALGVAKVALFGSLASLDARLTLAGLGIGLCTAPGAFVARAVLRRIPAHVHAGFMEAVVVAGALMLLWHARG